MRYGALHVSSVRKIRCYPYEANSTLLADKRCTELFFAHASTPCIRTQQEHLVHYDIPAGTRRRVLSWFHSAQAPPTRSIFSDLGASGARRSWALPAPAESCRRRLRFSDALRSARAAGLPPSALATGAPSKTSPPDEATGFP